MKKVRSYGLYLIAMLGLVTVMQANTYLFTDSVGYIAGESNPVFLNAGGNDSVSGLFDITPAYDPSTMTLLGATAWFVFADDCDLLQTERVKIELDGLFFDSGEVDGVLYFPLTYDWEGGILGFSLLASLQADGKLAYEVIMTQGDAYFLGAELDAIGIDKCHPPETVPDAGSTMAMLGLAMLGIAAIRRARK